MRPPSRRLIYKHIFMRGKRLFTEKCRPVAHNERCNLGGASRCHLVKNNSVCYVRGGRRFSPTIAVSISEAAPSLPGLLLLDERLIHETVWLLPLPAAPLPPLPCPLSAVTVSGCILPPRDDPAALAAYKEANDPLEGFNRAIFGFNEGTDILLFRPARRDLPQGPAEPILPTASAISCATCAARWISPTTCFRATGPGPRSRPSAS